MGLVSPVAAMADVVRDAVALEHSSVVPEGQRQPRHALDEAVELAAARVRRHVHDLERIAVPRFDRSVNLGEVPHEAAAKRPVRAEQ
eukprot:CAMPEP_0198604928 /NCGR_PEP_ID=MMETSP1462-20131121/153813_1 /TAXON_ID=1333877 /ORGANISM="Brandtodinium nutriculum, Strain RCC3387" /LENGTH=86 /DNA_ID=CAMNT_0044336721 /DNA_START=1 /DNA_END=262 /DNA_ORIENTATION=+